MNAQTIVLEIELRKRQEGVYSVELCCHEPDSGVDIRLGATQHTDFCLDVNQLKTLIYNPSAYAQELTRRFFASEAIRTMFANARAIAERSKTPLSICLLIAEESPELQGVYWELLNDPGDGSPLFTGDKVYFSRYLSSLSWRSVRLRPKARLRAMLLVANPLDISDYENMHPIPVEAEIDRTRRSLQGVPLTILGQGSQRASLPNLIAHLQIEKPDILYIICHGALRRGQPYLWLEDADGKTAVTAGSDLITQIKELAHLPVLVVLASCESAGQPSEAEIRTALGPQLAQVGIPAVVAMQGDISQETIERFMPIFFRGLQQDGRIDRAMSLARGRVRRQPDFWMPVLFSRLTSGVIYAEREPEKLAIRIGWRNWAAFAGLIMAATILIIVLAFPSARTELRASLPWVRCQWPLEVTSERKVAVAEFNMPEDFDNRAVKEEIRRSIKQIIRNLANNQGSILYCPVTGSPVDLAEKIDANILVYGEVIKEKGEWYVQPRYTIRPELSGASELTGDEVFGERINIGNDPTGAIANQGINELLGPHITNLSMFLDGVVQFKGAHYRAATDSFSRVLQAWPARKSEPLNSKGRDIVYLWLGNALYHIDEELEDSTCPFGEAAVADEAVAEFGRPLEQCSWKAYELGMSNEPYTRRLFLAQGNWWKELPAQEFLGTAQKCEDYSIAIEYYQQALAGPAEPLTGVKANINIGLAAILSGDGCGEAQSLYRQAVDSLYQAIDRLQGLAVDGEIRNYQALAWYTLGRVDSRLGDSSAAITDYSQALAITGSEGGYHEPAWQWQIRWEATIGRGRQYLAMAKNGDASAWEKALTDFQAVIGAYEKSTAPTDALYAGDAYLGAAVVLEAQGDASSAKRYRQKAAELLPPTIEKVQE